MRACWAFIILLPYLTFDPFFRISYLSKSRTSQPGRRQYSFSGRLDRYFASFPFELHMFYAQCVSSFNRGIKADSGEFMSGSLLQLKSDNLYVPKLSILDKMLLRRSKGRIIYQILSLCKNEGTGKTRIVYASNLNFANANEYLHILIKNGVIEVGPEKVKLYKTTQKGIELLLYFKAIQQLVPEICD